MLVLSELKDLKDNILLFYIVKSEIYQSEEHGSSIFSFSPKFFSNIQQADL